MLFLLLFLCVVLLWVVKSIPILNEKEMGVLRFLGKPVGFCNSGINFVPFPLYSLVIRPKKLFKLDYVASEVITKKGIYKGVEYGAQVLIVDSSAYLTFPAEITKDKGNLIKIVEKDIPYDKEGLRVWTEDSVVGSLRAVFATMTWMEVIEKIEYLKKEAEKKFQDADGALVMAGFNYRDLKIVIKLIKLPKDLEEALVGPDKQRLLLNAADFVSKRQAKEWIGMVVEALAYAKGKSIKQTQKEIDANPQMKKEFFDYAKMVNLRLEESERGTVTHVVVDGGDTKNDGNGNQSSFLGNLTKHAIEIFVAIQGLSKKTKKSPINAEKKDKKGPKKRKQMDNKEFEDWLDEDEE